MPAQNESSLQVSFHGQNLISKQPNQSLRALSGLPSSHSRCFPIVRSRSSWAGHTFCQLIVLVLQPDRPQSLSLGPGFLLHVLLESLLLSLCVPRDSALSSTVKLPRASANDVPGTARRHEIVCFCALEPRLLHSSKLSLWPVSHLPLHILGYGNSV